MISCIICSRQSYLSQEQKENIESTIGCEYEVVVIDSSKKNYSIFSAYNEGVRRAKGDILCFMHEDIIYHTNNWGLCVKEYFQNNISAGMIGVAGTHFLSSIPSGWWETETRSSYLLQGNIKDGEYYSFLDNTCIYQNLPTKVVAIDGLWMCIRKTIFDKVKWDDITYSGFHGYDLDMSLQVWSIGFEVHVIWDVLIEHKSYGLVSNEFYAAYDKLWNKWNGTLPLIIGTKLSKEDVRLRTKIVELNQIIRKQNTEIYNLKYLVHQTMVVKLKRYIKKLIHWIKR